MYRIKMLKKIKNKKVYRSMRRGFSIIEVLVTLFIFSLIAVTFYYTFAISTGYIIEAKNRSIATSLANEKMEILRNLNYDNIGTVGGIVEGNLNEDEQISSGGKDFRVLTYVDYVDDSFDGVGSGDENLVMTDYKIAKVIILWGEGDSKRVELVSRFVPLGIEIGDPNKGTLAVNVLSQEGVVIGANVNIQNSYVSPNVDMNRETDDNGQIYLPGADQSVQTYKLTVSKDGYETVQTLDPDAPGMTYVPFDKNGSVIAGDINISNITINKLADLKISSISTSGEIVSDALFSLIGGRQVDVDGNIFNFDETNQTTGASGEKIFSDISPGNFNFSLDQEITGYKFIGMDILSPFDLQPDEAKTIELKFAPEDTVWLLVTVSNDMPEFLEDAQVKLSDISGFDQTVSTTEDGVAFFPDSGELSTGDYTLEVSLDGFETDTSTISVVEETETNITLTESE